MKQIILLCLFFGMVSCGNHSEENKKIISSEVTSEIIEKSFPKLDSTRYNVGFLIMDGVFNTELTAPFDIFQHTIFRKNIKAMNVFTVANTNSYITSFEGMKINLTNRNEKNILPMTCNIFGL